jgi:hypothetical protein
MSLKDKAKKQNGAVVEFMEGREKAEEIPSKKLLTIENFDFLPAVDEKTGEKKEFAVIIFEEDTENFYFGGSVITDKLKGLKAEMTEEDWEEMNNNGIPVIFEKKASKQNKGQKYVTCTFYPEF